VQRDTASEGITALDGITRDCYRSFAVFPNAELLDDGRIYGVMSHAPISFFSGIASTHIDESEVPEIIERFRAKRCAFRWWVTPLTRPQGLVPVLQAHGMRHTYDAPGMTADLTAVPLDVPLPEGVTIRRLTSAAEMTHWLDVFMPAFSLPPEQAGAWRDAYVHCGFGDDAPWQHFVAFLGDQPVATTSSHLHGDLAGIYFVATLAAARGRGIGSAVTRAAMRHARDAGATVAALQSSESGYSVYRGLGFVDHGMLTVYDWRPEYDE
jgi:ribosomal protein S18 acetylase RimI-like enzyme